MENVVQQHVPQKEAKKAVNEYYGTKYTDSFRPQKKVPKYNSFRRYRSLRSGKKLKKKTTSIRRSYRRKTSRHNKSLKRKSRKTKSKSKSKSKSKK